MRLRVPIRWRVCIRSGRSVFARVDALGPASAALLAALTIAVLPARAAPPVEKLHVPAGFQVELVTDQVPNARAMTLGRFANDKGVLYVGSMQAGKVYAVDIDQGKAGAVHTIASGLLLPAGIAYRDGALYVSAVSRIVRFDAIDDHLDKPPAAVVVTDKLPAETHHGAKFLAFGPDGKLYVPTGAPCNICEPDERHADLARMNADGSGLEVVARGIRNTVGFDWSPTDKALWFTDNGRDLLGDDLPSDELNRMPIAGNGVPHFGYPYCHQGDSPDPEFGAKHACSEFVAPADKLGAHVAALGMRFYNGNQFPDSYRGDIFVAEHGSWNRSKKSGYVVAHVALDAQGHVRSHENFLDGFLQRDAAGRESAWGRPADVLVLPDGTLLVSDDQAGAIYRIKRVP